MKLQGGGTILGFIIGVVVGLGAALTVAVYVTKVPVPFLNKALSRTAEHDAAETKKNKDWDPNAPLYGKNPARPPAAAASGTVGTATPVAVAPESSTPKAATITAAPQPVKAEAKAAAAAPNDPLGDLAKARASTAGPDPFDYFVQAGAFRTVDDAEAQRAKLAIMGWEAKVTEREQSGRTVFRVRIGPYGKKDDADRIKEKLDTAGLETALVRVQR
ncbi:MAG TPA: SPOR domain-containing protein [Burkholderiaceae bacterium]|nr:SPOR domain-containing protein [Burkholderiaceae bacterium]